MVSGIRGKAFWNRGFKFLVLERVEDLIKVSDAVRSLPFHSSICIAHEFSKNFSFLLQTALSGFYPRVTLFLFSFFSFFYCPIVHLKIQNLSRNG